LPQRSGNFERPDIFRPPSERRSYFLPLTSGCSNNTCAFCSYYGSRLRIREVDEVKQEIDALSLFMKRGIGVPSMPSIVYLIAQQWDRRRIFLQDGDALVYPYSKLVEVLQYVNEKFPRLDRIGTYATPQDILRRSQQELETLKELKLGIFYTGVESGDDEVLKNVEKGVNRQQIVEAGRKVKQAGITLSVTVILGLGGVEGSEKHTVGTARILSDIDPDYAGALTLILVPGTPLYEQCQKGDFHPIDPFQSLEELKTIVEESSFSNCFFSSMHASNYLPIRGRLPNEKQRMLKELENTLKARDSSKLRPEFLRGL
jgi:radical SAM superfamily enzyme YgiQ (UPF0313 family)